MWTKVDGQICRRDGNDLVCKYAENRKAHAPNLFGRKAYHMFASISASKEIKALTQKEILSGNWVASELYRSVLIDDVNAVADDGRDSPAALAPSVNALEHKKIPIWIWMDYQKGVPP